jgi:N-formylglutamate deformylase
MAAKGMRALYTHDTKDKRFRSTLTGPKREKLLNKYYRPHHAQLTHLVQDAIARSNRVLIIDAHSFPNRPLPCDDGQATDRPDICLGTDAFHTPGLYSANTSDAVYRVLDMETDDIRELVVSNAEAPLD